MFTIGVVEKLCVVYKAPLITIVLSILGCLTHYLGVHTHMPGSAP